MALFRFLRNSNRSEAEEEAEKPSPSDTAAPPPVPAKPAAPAAPALQTPVPPEPPAPAPAAESVAPAPSAAPPQKEQLLYRSLMESLYDGVLVVGTGGQVVDSNSRAHRLFGYPDGHLWYVPLRTLVPSMVPEVLTRVREHAAEGRFSVLNAGCVRQDGTHFAAEIAVRSTRLISEGDLVLCVRDVDRQRKARERMLRESHATHDTHAAMAVCDAAGAVRYVNAAFVRLWGCESDAAAAGRALQDFFAPPEAADELLARARQDGSFTAERVALGAGGKEFPVVAVASFCPGEESEEPSFVLAVIGTVGLRTASVRLRA